MPLKSGLLGQIPAAPILTYTGAGQFTIQNYNPALTYVIPGSASRSGAVITVTASTTTVKAKYAGSSLESPASTLYVAAHARVLDTPVENLSSVGCGPRPNLCCTYPGSILDPNTGATCGGSPGTVHEEYCDPGCGDAANCYTLFMTCYTWHWTDYSGSGYTLISTTWGKVVNA